MIVSVAKEGRPREPPVPAPSTGSTFSLLETLANLNEPKQPDVVKKIDKGPPETEEERKKRLRKEERRKLRVSFKPDDSLVEIRHFVHDPEEEISPQDSMMRDVDDIAGEGRMLKLHKDLDVDDEEDSRSAGQDFFPWFPPTGTFLFLCVLLMNEC